jgi:hypothetical protein
MSRTHVTALLALLPLASLASIAAAQEGGLSGQGRVREKMDVQTCGASGGGSRTKANCEVGSTTVQAEKEVTFTLELPPQPSAQCEAISSTDYQQRGTVARVQSKIETETCAAASGEFTITLRVRDETGALQSLEFNETWTRDDHQDVSLSADYPIGENVDLVSARVRGLRCTCADPPAEE